MVVAVIENFLRDDTAIVACPSAYLRVELPDERFLGQSLSCVYHHP